ncbi:hypothetical protein OIU77_024012 [Salix suchowensis]|uniref:Uncharacterized protein n=1 Tax=Salix suchowensis TaxID=1278906 RepID=A0ABQ9C5U8_9ROSI|nr:hypothetical protein OIU77_024012 [Salix suchowensis]
MSSLEAANKVVMKWLEPKNEQDQKRKKTIDDLYRQTDEMKRQHDKQVDEMKKQFAYDNHVLYQSCQLSPEIEYRQKNISVQDGPVTPSPLPQFIVIDDD